MTFLEGVFWDLDGTIANTELEAHLPAFNKAFIDLGLNWYWDEETYISLLKINGGMNRISHYAKIKNDKFPDSFIKQIHQRKQNNYLNLVKHGAVSLKVGVFRLISELMNKNIRQFIVTSSSRVQVDLLTQKLFKGLKPFEFFITSEDVKFHKPNPLPYLKAINLSGIKSQNILVFEDSYPGVKSSTDANLKTILVQSNIPINLNNELKIDFMIDKLGDEENYSNILKGPKLYSEYIDFNYLNQLINFKN